MDADQHLYLTGYRGTGKSAVGVTVARRLDRPVIDLDQVVEANSGKSIRQIFAVGGEVLFRKWESEALITVSQADPAVISLGGGAILADLNRDLIRRTGVCVWLTASAETIVRRIDSDRGTAESRPALTDLTPADEIRSLLRQRHSAYQAVSHYQIDTENKSIEQVADEIVRWVS